MKLFRKAKKGFTLVELVVVIAVIAILGAVSVGAYFGITESAKASKLEQESKQALNNIRLVALSGSDNHVLDSTGLHIVDIDVFEKDLREASGIDYDVITTDVSVSGPTIYLVEKAISPLKGNPTTYSSIKYYTDEVTNSCGEIDVLTEEYTKVTESFTVTSSIVDFAGLQTAVNNAEANDVIKLNADIEVVDHLDINGKTLTLDLNGHTLTAKYEAGTNHDGVVYPETHTILVRNNSNVTITGNGKVFATDYRTVEDSSNHTFVALSAYNSNVTVENGTFYAYVSGSASYSKNSTITINGGTFESEQHIYENADGETRYGYFYPVNVNTSESNPETNFDDNYVINAGTFVNFDIENHPTTIWHVTKGAWIGASSTVAKVGNNTVVTRA